MDILLNTLSLEDIGNINLEDFDDFWTKSILKDELLSPLSHYFVAKSGEDILGFAGLKFLLDEAHITNIVVRKDKRRLGIGSILLEALINKAKETSTLITLEVNEQNLAAIQLYQKYNFQIVGTRKKYYDNKFDAYIMTKYFR